MREILAGGLAQRQGADVGGTYIQGKERRLRDARTPRTIDDGDARVLIDLPHERGRIAAHAQQASISRQRVGCIERLRYLQEHTGEQAREARVRIALSFDGLKQAGTCGAGLCGGDEAMFQAFIHAADGTQHIGRGGTKHVEQRLIERRGSAEWNAAQRIGAGHCRGNGIPVAALERGAHACRGGERRGKRVVIAGAFAGIIPIFLAINRSL